MRDLLTAKRAWGAVAAIALVIGLVASVGPGIDAIDEAADWLGEHSAALVVLGVIVLGSFLFLVGRMSASWRTSPGHEAADRETYEDLKTLVPRHVIEFFREHDFGNSWSGQLTQPIYELAETRNAVENRFHDRITERKRKQLHTDSDAFIRKLAGYSSPAHHGESFELNEKEWVRSHPPGDEMDRRFEAHRRELNELADAMVTAYDDLIATARKRLPGV